MSKYWFDAKGNLVIEDAKIFWCNFSGKERKRNPAGVRNFCVYIEDHKIADKLVRDAWNVKYRPAENDGEEAVPYINVAVRYDVLPPTVYMVAGKNKTLINEKLVKDLDSADIENVDLIIRGRKWWDEDVKKVKAYLKTGYFVILRNVFADKYDFIDEDDIPFDV